MLTPNLTRSIRNAGAFIIDLGRFPSKNEGAVKSANYDVVSLQVPPTLLLNLTTTQGWDAANSFQHRHPFLAFDSTHRLIDCQDTYEYILIYTNTH